MSPRDDAGARDAVALCRPLARDYVARHHLHPAEAVDGDPVLGPVEIERDGRTVVAVRWLSGGRGSDFVQVEFDVERGQAFVYGARGGDDLPTAGPVEIAQSHPAAGRRTEAPDVEGDDPSGLPG